MQEASVCEQYPVLNYTLVLKSPSYGEIRQLVSPSIQEDNHFVIQQNALYYFKIIVTNAAGMVSTEYSKPLCEFHIICHWKLSLFIVDHRHHRCTESWSTGNKRP